MLSLNLQRPTTNTTQLFPPPRHLCTTRTTLLPRALHPVVKRLSYCHTHESLNPFAPAAQLGQGQQEGQRWVCFGRGANRGTTLVTAEQSKKNRQRQNQNQEYEPPQILEKDHPRIIVPKLSGSFAFPRSLRFGTASCEHPDPIGRISFPIQYLPPKSQLARAILIHSWTQSTNLFPIVNSQYRNDRLLDHHPNKPENIGKGRGKGHSYYLGINAIVYAGGGIR